MTILAALIAFLAGFTTGVAWSWTVIRRQVEERIAQITREETR